MMAQSKTNELEFYEKYTVHLFIFRSTSLSFPPDSRMYESDSRHVGLKNSRQNISLSLLPLSLSLAILASSQSFYHKNYERHSSYLTNDTRFDQSHVLITLLPLRRLCIWNFSWVPCTCPVALSVVSCCAQLMAHLCWKLERTTRVKRFTLIIRRSTVSQSFDFTHLQGNPPSKQQAYDKVKFWKVLIGKPKRLFLTCTA